MAQERFWNWQDDDSTFRMNQRDLGIIPAGRYRGFDRKSITATGWNLILRHDLTGHTKVKLDLSTVPEIAVWKTKQGVLIQEDASISLTIDPVVGVISGGRYDLVIGEHNFEEITGGTTAIYKVIKGTASTSPVVPAVTNALTQVILGVLFIPFNALDIQSAGVVWTPSEIPNISNDPSFMRLGRLEDVTGLKKFKQTMNKGVEAAIDVANKKIVLPSLSNKYWIPETDQTQSYEITAIEIQGDSTNRGFGWDLEIHTEQILTIVDNGTIESNKILLPSKGRINILKNESLKLSDTQGHLNNPFTPITDGFVLTNGGQVNLNGLNKMTGLFSCSNNADVDLFDMIAETLEVRANFITLSLLPLWDGAPLSYIQNPFVNHPDGGLGTRITVKNYGAGLNIVHQASSVPAGYARIETAILTNFYAGAESTMEFILTVSGWSLINVSNGGSTTQSLITDFKNLYDVSLNAVVPDKSVAIFDTASGRWKDKVLKTAIETTQLLMDERTTGNTCTITGSDGLVTLTNGLGLQGTAGKQFNFIDIDSPTAVSRLSHLPDNYPLNSILIVTYLDAQNSLLLNATGTPDTGWLTIKSKEIPYDIANTIYKPTGRPLKFRKRATYWELDSSEFFSARKSVVNYKQEILELGGIVDATNSLPPYVYKDQNGFVGFRRVKFASTVTGAGSSYGTLFILPSEYLPSGDAAASDHTRLFAVPCINVITKATRMVILSLVDYGATLGHMRIWNDNPTSFANGLKEGDIIDLGSIVFDSKTMPKNE